MGSFIWKALLISLFSTIILEEIYALLWGVRRKKDILLVLLVNVLTNPLVVLCYYILIDIGNINPVVIKAFLEVGAVTAEALYYRKYGERIKHPFIFSILCNAFSFGIGILISELI